MPVVDGVCEWCIELWDDVLIGLPMAVGWGSGVSLL